MVEFPKWYGVSTDSALVDYGLSDNTLDFGSKHSGEVVITDDEGNELNVAQAIRNLQEWALPVNMIVQCDYCGVFGLRGFTCPKCGAPIDLKGKL